MKRKFDLKPLLALAAIIGFFGAIIVLISAPEIPGSVKDILLILIGALVAIVKDVFGYYFGSSEGSARKTELLQPTPLMSTASIPSISSAKPLDSEETLS